MASGGGKLREKRAKKCVGRGEYKKEGKEFPIFLSSGNDWRKCGRIKGLGEKVFAEEEERRS